jgi:predicted regulator of Ras-like GTPase activity (Roadblock/LC7/MglB family)
MSNIKESLADVLNIDGTVGAALGDWHTGLSLGQSSADPANFPESLLEQAIALNSEVIRSKDKARNSLGIADRIEDILITLEGQYHLIRLAETVNGLFFYMVMDRDKANLGLARMKLRDIEKSLKV